ncbi:hypothetical protein GCM10027399_05250 [Curvibacter fontanus]|jgi:hypothetical protein
MQSSKSFTSGDYQLYPSPRNTHRILFEHQVFVPHPYALIDLPAMGLQGRYSLFAASRLADNKQGQLVSFENEADVTLFNAKFEP